MHSQFQNMSVGLLVMSEIVRTENKHMKSLILLVPKFSHDLYLENFLFPNYL